MKDVKRSLRFYPAGGRPAALDPDAVAIAFLAFLAADPDRLGRFLALTGLDPSGLRTAAGQPHFARSILAYAGGDDAVLVAFAQAEGHDPEALGQLIRKVTEGKDETF